MNRRFGLFLMLTLLVSAVALTACLSGLPQPPAPASETAAVTAQPAVITPTLAVTASKALTPTIVASKATTVTAAAVVSATVGVTPTASMTATPASPAKPPAPITGTLSPALQDVTWTLESYGKPDKPVKVLPQTPITVRFGSDGTVAGSAGCNNYNGTYVASGNELSVGPLAITRMMCTKPVMLQEQAYLDALQAARTYGITPDGKLKVTYDEGSVLMYGAQAAAASRPTGTAITPTIGVTATQPITATRALTATGATGVAPQVTPRAVSRPIRIQFPKGATSDKVEGYVEPGTPVLYVLRAAAGQTLTIQPTAAKGSVQVSILGADRKPLSTVTSPQKWSGILPASQDYYLIVSVPKGGTATNYTLATTVVGKPGAPTSPENEPTVIRFDPGTTTTQVSGQVKPGGSVPYTLYAKAGQKLTVSISANGPMRVAITSPQDQLIGVAEAREPWAGVLPATGEYRLTVQAPVDIAMVSYTLDITLK